MEKRTMIALGIAIVFLFIFQTYFMPRQQPATEQHKAEQTQTQATDQAKEGVEEQRKVQTVPQGGIISPTTGTAKGKAITAPATDLREAKEITVTTPLLKVTLTDMGGGIKSVKLLQYREDVKDKAEKEIIEDVMFHALPAVTRGNDINAVNDMTFFQSDRQSLSVSDRPETINFTGTLGDGKKIKKSYTFHPDAYTVDLSVHVEPLDNDKTFVNFAVITDKNKSRYTFKGPFLYNGKKFEQIEKMGNPVEVGKDFQYTGFDEGFFAFIYIPDDSSRYPATIFKNEKNMPVIRISMDKETLSGKIFFGPKKAHVLEALNVKAEKIIDFGWFNIIAKPLIVGLNLSNRVTRNYGIDIILLTILIKIIFYPLSVKSYKSMKEMQKLQPQVQKLRDKYKDDKQKLNQEMMDMYKRKGVNPMGGCLPMIIQLPVFFALYKALSGAIELRHAPFMFWINDLSAPEDLFSFAVMGFSVPIRILPLVMGITQVLQQKMTPTTADPMQAKMMLFMPIFFTFLFWGFPSGLVLYWLVNNVISIGQQYYINKKVS